MGLTTSTSLGQLSENKVLQKFVGTESIPDSDEYWDTLFTFSFNPPKHNDFAVFYKATLPLLEKLVLNNPRTKNIISLILVCLKKATPFRDESKCESNLTTLCVRNGLFIIRCCLHHLIQTQDEKNLLNQLDTPTEPTHQTTNKDHVTSPIEKSSVSISVEDSVPLETPGTNIKLLIHGVISLLDEIPLVPFTYDIHVEAINLLIVILSGQVSSGDLSSNSIVAILMESPRQMANGLVQRLMGHFITQPPPPPEYLRSQPAGLVSSITSGLLSLILPNRSIIDPTSQLAVSSVLLLLILVHQHSRGHNPFRESLNLFCDDHEDKEDASFHLGLDKLYTTICSELSNEQTTLFFYQLLHGNTHFSSFVFSRTNIDCLVLPLLKQLNSEGNQPSHHSYMLLIILLILSQDECFNKSIHEKTVKGITWSGDKPIPHTSLGSLMVIVLVRTVHRNIQHLRDKFLHTNCLATLANMSSQFNKLSLEASEKIVNLFRVLSKRYLRSKGEVTTPTIETTPTTGTFDTVPITPTTSIETGTNSLQPTDTSDTQTLEEILQMLLEILNSSLTHTLHNNPHLVYSMLYQKEVFTPFHSRPGFIDLVQNIEMVITYFAGCVEKGSTPPFSSKFVLETIEKGSLAWPKNRLRSFPELKFRYVEESQPEEFFIPYIWILVHKHSQLYFDPTKITFSLTQS